MNSAALANPLTLIDSQTTGLIGLPAEQPAQRTLPGSADNLLRSIVQTLDAMLLDVISKRTAAELQEAEEEYLPQYLSLVVAFSRVASKAIDRKTIVRLNEESFCLLEAEIRESGEQCFGERMQERAMATVWMLRKISGLLAILQTAKVVDPQKEDEFAGQFFYHAIRSRFYIDCLVTSMRTKRSLYREALPQVDDGLRSSINAYAWVKQAVDLRLPNDEVEPEPAWTADDEELVQASMSDMDRLDRD